MNASSAIDYIYDLQRIGIKFGLNNTKQLLHGLGDPHLNFKIIHIAVTNGKGSTAAMITSILKASGFKVGLYTSPHLIHLSERIQVNGIPISEEDLKNGAEEIRQIILDLHFTDSHPTYFETVTCLAFSYFSRQGVDWAVIEAGMGGRWDATNVCSPQTTIITNISLDHQEFLGETLGEIAKEKAGIIKPGCPVVCGVTQKETLSVIRQKCISVGAPLFLVPELYSYEEGKPQAESLSEPLTFENESPAPEIHITRAGIPFLSISLPLCGRFQIQNTFLAIEVIERLREKGVKIKDRTIKDGIKQTVWPGRVQIVSRKPYFILDGAHNPSAAENLAETIRTRFRYNHLIMVLGILKDKDIAGICRATVPLASHVILTAPDSDRAATPDDLHEIILNIGLAEGRHLRITQNISEAILKAKTLAKNTDLILVTGSLYTVGATMAFLDITPYPTEGTKVMTE